MNKSWYKKILKIKIVLLHSESIGRLLSTTEFYFRYRYINRDKDPLVFISGKPILPYIVKMYKKKGFVIQNRLIHSILIKIVKMGLGNRYIEKLEKNGFYDWETWNKAPAQLDFTPAEYDRGKNLLTKMGVRPDAQYVCIHARDNQYTDTFQKRESWWEKNDFRDCSIDHYMAAAEYLSKKGIYLIRLGNRSSVALKTDNPYIIDYATKYQSDFGDVFLPATCKFFLGNTAAIYLLASVFNVPVAYANMVPVGECGRKKTDKYILKKFFDEKKNQYISYKKLRNLEKSWFPYQTNLSEQTTYILNRSNGLFYSRFNRKQLEILKEKGIKIEENSHEEILWLAKEMNNMIDGSYKEPSDFDDVQQMHLSVFDPHHPFSLDPPVSTICYDFVKKNKRLWE